jgi:dynein heavy chain, axonemal
LKKEPAEFEKADYSKYNIEELLLTSVSTIPQVKIII